MTALTKAVTTICPLAISPLGARQAPPTLFALCSTPSVQQRQLPPRAVNRTTRAPPGCACQTPWRVSTHQAVLNYFRCDLWPARYITETATSLRGENETFLIGRCSCALATMNDFAAAWTARQPLAFAASPPTAIDLHQKPPPNEDTVAQRDPPGPPEMLEELFVGHVWWDANESFIKWLLESVCHVACTLCASSYGSSTAASSHPARGTRDPGGRRGSCRALHRDAPALRCAGVARSAAATSGGVARSRAGVRK
jgi:hypothetical protein